MWTNQQKAEFATRINVKRETYDKPPLSDQAIKLEISDLEHLSFDDVVQAMKDHRDQYKPPNAASILLVCEGDIESKAIEAAEKLEKAVSRYGIYRSPVFDDNRLQAAVGRIGWIKICQTPTMEEFKFVKRDIQKLYKAMPANVEPPELLGYFDAENGRGRTDENTVYIGDQTKAKALLSHIEQVKLLESKQ